MKLALYLIVILSIITAIGISSQLTTNKNWNAIQEIKIQKTIKQNTEKETNNDTFSIWQLVLLISLIYAFLLLIKPLYRLLGRKDD